MNAIIDYFLYTSLITIATQFLYYFGWMPVFGVTVWGMIQVWQDMKQGQYVAALEWHLLQIHIPAGIVQTPKGMENFFQNLAGSKSSITWKENWLLGKVQPWFSLEIVSNGGKVSFYIRSQQKYVDLVEAAMYAQYPEAQIVEVADYVDVLPNDWPDEKMDLWGSEMTLQKDEHFPIKTWAMFEHQGEKDLRFKDPILPVIEILGKMKPDEQYWIQILIKQPDSQDWSKEGVKYINKTFGKPEKKKKPGMFSESVGWIPGEIMKQTTGLVIGGEPVEKKQEDFAMFKITTAEKYTLEAVNEKISKIGWKSKVRIVYSAPHKTYRKGTIASFTKGIFHQYSHLNWNKFGLHDPSTPKDDYFWQTWQMAKKQKRLLYRYKNRKMTAGSTCYILNSEELATLFHFPSADARTPILTAPGAKRAEPPIDLQWTLEDTILPNFDRSSSDVTITTPARTEPLSVPTPLSPTGVVTPLISKEGQGVVPNSPVAHHSLHVPPAESQMPVPGQPAPLPPGLDLVDTEYDPTPDAPDNLPM